MMYGCLVCGTNCGRWEKCLEHMETCCPRALENKKGLQQKCLLGHEECMVPISSDDLPLKRFRSAVQSDLPSDLDHGRELSVLRSLPRSPPDHQSPPVHLPHLDDAGPSQENVSTHLSTSVLETSKRHGISNLPAWMTRQKYVASRPNISCGTFMPQQSRSPTGHVGAVSCLATLTEMLHRGDDCYAREGENGLPLNSLMNVRETSRRHGISNLPAWMTRRPHQTVNSISLPKREQQMGNSPALNVRPVDDFLTKFSQGR